MRKALVKKRIFEDEFMAAAFGDTEWLRQSVINADGVVKYDEKGYTSLHIAASFGRLNCIKLLVEEFGYSVDLPTKTGIQPLMFAISNKTGNNSIECVQYLISNGANPSFPQEVQMFNTLITRYDVTQVEIHILSRWNKILLLLPSQM